MSYLGYPRLNFAGTFQSDAATVNNVPPYFDNDLFEPRFQWRTTMPDFNGLWNPRGSGAMRLSDIRVTSACGPDGTTATTPAADPAVHCRLADDDRRAGGKFVDLDPQNQMVPEIYGLRMRLLDSAGDPVFSGDFKPVGMEDMWIRAKLASGRGDPAATYQSVLTGVEWARDIASPVLRALREATQEGALSVKFNLDGVEDGLEHWPDNISYGRIVGSIGPYRTGEPRHLVAGRRLRAADGSGFNHAPARVDEAGGRIFVDLGNSVRAQSRGGPLVEPGDLRLAVLDKEGVPQPLAPLKGLESGFYERTAGIATAALDAVGLAAVAAGRLAVVAAADPRTVLLAENADATFVRADGAVFRIYPEQPHDKVTTTLYATRFGRPASGVALSVGGGSVPAALTVPAKVVTGAGGRAEVTIGGRDPGNPRKWLDGVAAEIGYGFAERPGEPEGVLAVRVFDLYKAPPQPTWNRDVKPIFQQYANLFPVMHDVFDLANYNHVVRHATYVKKTLLASTLSPNHMPVTRDLSPGKRDMIVSWLDTKPAPPVLDITSVAELRSVLQQALLVEQATVAPYLAALFSIKPGHNVEIAGIIGQVVREEMQHMAQVCNILNAVGGAPQIGRPGKVPTFPGALPGPVLPDLKIRLRKLSIEHVRDVFMAIEKPEFPTVAGKRTAGAPITPDSVKLDRRGAVLSADTTQMQRLEEWFTQAEYTPQTIGWFYNQLARAIVKLDKQGKLFTGDPARQVSWPDAPGTLYKVTDKRSALLAIYQIIEEGEGSPHDLNGNNIADPGEFGHYYRFEEIVKGRRLIKNGRGEWVYEGAAIPFDPDGVHPVVDDADTYRLPADSAARRDSLMCDESYTGLLTALHRVFNGHPDELDDSVGLMYQLQVQAKKLLQTPAPDGSGKVLGASFQSPGIRF